MLVSLSLILPGVPYVLAGAMLRLVWQANTLPVAVTGVKLKMRT